MIFLETYLVVVLITLFVAASASDLKNGIVTNKSILIALGAGILGAIPYYAFFATDCLPSFIINVVISNTISLILYAMGIWGAGDSKLFSTVILVFPARLYCLNNRSLASCFLMVAITFIVAFGYVVVDTIIVGLRQKDLFKLSKAKINWKDYIKGLLFYILLLNIINAAVYAIVPSAILSDTILMTAIHFIIILVGLKLEEKAKWIHIIVMGVAWVSLVMLGRIQLGFSRTNYLPYIIVLLLIMFRTIADKYNYKTIPIDELKPGMILSMGSILCFVGSRVQGLPTISTEDLKSRLTKDEVESIGRWAKTNKGQEQITIVRKIPFALFIGIGSVIFAVLEVIAK